jgi:hypothetical protein
MIAFNNVRIIGDIMLKKTVLIAISTVLLTALMLASMQAMPIAAQGGDPATPDGKPFQLKIKGIVAILGEESITLTDGTVVMLNGVELPDGIQVGSQIKIWADVIDDTLFAVKIRLGDDDDEDDLGGTATATVDPTLDPTIDPTIDPTVDPTIDPTIEPTAEATLEVNCPEAQHAHPVGVRLAAEFGVSYEEIMSWKCKGYGFGEIARAYSLAAQHVMSVNDVFAMRASGMGWGNIRKGLEGTAEADKGKASAAGGQEDKNKGKGPDKDKGQGQGQDKGKAKGKDK